MWGRARVGRADVGRETALTVPIEVTGRGCAGRVVVKDPEGEVAEPAAAIAVRVPVEPEGRAVHFVVGSTGGGGALLGVG